MRLLPTIFIFAALFLFEAIFSTSAISFEDPCADGGCAEPDPCADGACEPIIEDPCSDGSCVTEPDPCADGSCDPPVEDPCADGGCAEPDPCADGSCDFPLACTEAAWNCIVESELCPESGQQAVTCTLIDATCSNPESSKPAEVQSCTPTVCTPGANRLGRIPESLQDEVSCRSGQAKTVCNAQGQWEFSFCLEDDDDGGPINPAPVQNPITDPVVTVFAAQSISEEPEHIIVADVISGEPEPITVLEVVGVRNPSDGLFISTLVPDTGCVVPGAETFLFASIKNKANKKLENIRITAIVHELDLRVVSGPFNIRKDSSVSRFLNFIVPPAAKSGVYYIRVSVTSKDDASVKYRIFEVNRRC